MLINTCKMKRLFRGTPVERANFWKCFDPCLVAVCPDDHPEMLRQIRPLLSVDDVMTWVGVIWRNPENIS